MVTGGAAAPSQNTAYKSTHRHRGSDQGFQWSDPPVAHVSHTSPASARRVARAALGNEPLSLLLAEVVQRLLATTILG